MGNFTHSHFTTEGPNATTRQDNWHQVSQKSVNEGWAFIGRYQKIFGPTLINELNVSYIDRPWNNQVEDSEVQRNRRDKVGFRAGQFYPSNNPLNLVPNATFGGVTGAATLALEARFPLTTDHWIFTFADHVSKTLSSHTLKFGLYADRVWATQGVAGLGLPFNGACAGYLSNIVCRCQCAHPTRTEAGWRQRLGFNHPRKNGHCRSALVF